MGGYGTRGDSSNEPSKDEHRGQGCELGFGHGNALWEFRVGRRGYVFGDRGFLAGNDILGSVELSQMETELERSKGGYEDQIHQVERHIVNALP